MVSGGNAPDQALEGFVALLDPGVQELRRDARGRLAVLGGFTPAGGSTSYGDGFGDGLVRAQVGFTLARIICIM